MVERAEAAFAGGTIVAGADVKLNIADSFYLDEAAIRKIAHILEERSKGAKAKSQIRISRSDNFSFVTASVEQIFAEQNGPTESIAILSFFTVPTESLHYDLTFDKHEGISGRFVGNDRDQVFLLFSDIDQFLRNYVVQKNFVTRWFSKTKKTFKERATLPLWMLLGMLTSFYFLAYGRNYADILRLLEAAKLAPDVRSKLDALLISQHAATSRLEDFDPMWALVKSFAFIGVLFIVWAAIVQLLRHLHPANVFCLGKQIADYDKRVALRSKLLWVVVVGFLISIAASYFFGILPRLSSLMNWGVQLGSRKHRGSRFSI